MGAPQGSPRSGALSSQLPGVLAADTESPLGVALTQDCPQPGHREPFQASPIQGWGRAESPQAQTLPPWATTRGEGRAPAELPVGPAKHRSPASLLPFLSAPPRLSPSQVFFLGEALRCRSVGEACFPGNQI